MSYNIVIADDHPAVRNGIAQLIQETDDDLRVIGEAADGRELLALLEKQLPDLVVLDVSMPRMSGIEAARCVKSLYPVVKILIYTMYADPEYRMEALSTGVDGYFLKTDTDVTLVSVIAEIRRGEVGVP